MLSRLSLPGCVTACRLKSLPYTEITILHNFPDYLCLLKKSISHVAPVNCSGSTHSSGTTEMSAPESHVTGNLCASSEPKSSLSLKGMTLSDGIWMHFT